MPSVYDGPEGLMSSDSSSACASHHITYRHASLELTVWGGVAISWAFFLFLEESCATEFFNFSVLILLQTRSDVFRMHLHSG